MNQSEAMRAGWRQVLPYVIAYCLGYKVEVKGPEENDPWVDIETFSGTPIFVHYNLNFRVLPLPTSFETLETEFKRHPCLLTVKNSTGSAMFCEGTIPSKGLLKPVQEFGTHELLRMLAKAWFRNFCSILNFVSTPLLAGLAIGALLVLLINYIYHLHA